MSRSPGSSDGRVILVGAGKFSAEVSDIASVAGYAVAALIEGTDQAQADASATPPVLWIDDQATFEPDLPIAPAIGSVERRALTERLIDEGRRLESIIHPSAIIAPSADIGPGCVIGPGAIIGARTQIGLGTIVHRGAMIGHHTTIGSHSFLGPGANLAGSISIGEQAFIAIGAVVREKLTIGDGVVIGAGAVAVADVADGMTVVGVPARPMKTTP